MRDAIDEQLDAAAITVATSDDKAAVNAAFSTLASLMGKIINGIARRHFAPGIDRDDIKQTCLLALWHCCTDYDPQHPFMPFAAHSMQNKVSSFITANRRRRDEPLNNSVGYHPATSHDGEEWDDSLSNALIEQQPDPEPSQTFGVLNRRLDARLTDVERIAYDAFTEAVEAETLHLHNDDGNYGQLRRTIRQKHRKRWSAKRIDNALQRVKRKAKKVYADEVANQSV